MTIALVDADIVAYRSAASAEKDSLEIACIRATKTLQDIMSVTGADEYKLFLSGSVNFRKELYPDYKANRRDMQRPQHLEDVREYLVLTWGANVTFGYEADDAIGINMESDGSTICCSIDKDLLQLPGLHFNFVTGKFEEIDERLGWVHFYHQLVLGDRSDNVPGYDGKMRVKWPKFLDETRVQLAAAATPRDMFQIVAGLYKLPQEELIRNGRLLYIWRREADEWQPPTTQATTS